MFMLKQHNFVVARCLETETGEGGLTVPAVLGSLIAAHQAFVDGPVDLVLEWTRSG